MIGLVLGVMGLTAALSDPFGYAGVTGGKTLAPGEKFAAAAYGWQHRTWLADEVQTLDVALGAGLAEVHEGGLSVGLGVPVIVDERLPGRDLDWELGDIRAEGKVNVFDRDIDFFGLGARVWSELPTGARRSTVTNRGAFSAGAEAIIEGKIDWLRGALNAGYEWVDEGIEDRLRLRGAIGISPLRDIAGFEPFEVFIEAATATRADRPWDHEEDSPVELLGGARWSGGPEGMFAVLAGGGALSEGIGAASGKVVAAIGIRF